MSFSKKTTFVQSPDSSNGATESVRGTPETMLTAFSQEDASSLKQANTVSTPLRAAPQDPFVSTGIKLKVGQKLSATASAFQPFALKVAANTPMVAHGSGSTEVLPGTMQYLEKVVASHSVRVGGSQSVELTQQGTFSTDTGASRCIKVATICQCDVMQAVKDSIEVSFQCLATMLCSVGGLPNSPLCRS